MKKSLFIIILLVFSYSCFAQQQNRTVRMRDLTDSLNVIRAAIAAGGSGALPDSTVFTSELLPYIDKTSAETITGEKTFSNNKTVFGTTTSDSVGVRGKIVVDQSSIFRSNLDVTKRFRIGDYSLPANAYFNYTPANSLAYLYNSSLIFGKSLNDVTYSGKQAYTAADGAWIAERNGSLYVFDGIRTDGEIFMQGDIFTNPDTSRLRIIEGYDDTLNINSTNLFINGNPFSVGGSVSNADSLGGLPALSYVTKSGLDGWTTNLYTGSANEFRLGKSYNTKRFNNGAYSDVWNIDYVIPPYELSANWLFPNEHRTDYYNDTITIVSSVANIFNIDGTGTPLWRTTDARISGVETQINVGDLPDSTILDWAYAGLFGNRIILSEANKTAVPSRFPMPVYGNYFQLGAGSFYTYPKLYTYYSNLADGNVAGIEEGYHFYGEGNFPSYFGGNIYTDGYLKVQDSIIIGTSTVKIYPDSITVGGIRLAKITESGGVLPDSVVFTSEIQGDTSDYSITQIDSLLALAGTSLQSITYPDANTIQFKTGIAIQLDPTTLEINGTDQLTVVGGAGFDSIFVYQKIDALEDSITNLRAAINNLIDAMNAHGIDIGDNNPPAKPTSYVAVGGTSQTQYVADWTNPGDADLDSLRWYEGPANDSTQLVWIVSLPETDTAYTRTGRTANTTYWSAIKAVDDSGNVSYFSNIDSATTLASAETDTGFFKLDAEDGLANLTLTNGSYIIDTSGFSYAGSKCYKIRGNSGILNVYADVTAFPAGYGNEDTIWVSYRVYIPASTTTNETSNDYQYLTLLGSGGDVNGDNGDFGISTNGSANIDGWVKPFGTEVTTNFSVDTWHKIEIKYIQGTGANATDSIWVDGTAIYGTTTGTGTVDTDGFRFGYYNFRLLSGEAIYFDDIIFKRTRVQ